MFLFCFRIFSRPTLYLVPKSPWSPPTWDLSSVFPYRSWPWWYGCLLVSYFLGCFSTWVFLTFPHDYIEVIQAFGKNTMKVPLCPSQFIISGDTWYQPISLLLMLRLISQLLWCLPDCSSEKWLSAFVFSYYLRSETLLTSCFSRHICLDFIIHQWSVPTQLLLWCLCNDNFVFYPIDYNSILSFILMLKLF